MNMSCSSKRQLEDGCEQQEPFKYMKFNDPSEGEHSGRLYPDLKRPLQDNICEQPYKYLKLHNSRRERIVEKIGRIYPDQIPLDFFANQVRHVVFSSSLHHVNQYNRHGAIRFDIEKLLDAIGNDVRYNIYPPDSEYYHDGVVIGCDTQGFPIHIFENGFYIYDVTKEAQYMMPNLPSMLIDMYLWIMRLLEMDVHNTLCHLINDCVC
jgi:hypothetical protein